MNTNFGNANATYFYGRVTGYLIPPTTGEYTIGLNSNAGVNLYICGQLVEKNDLASNHAMAANLNYSTGVSASILLNAGCIFRTKPINVPG